MAAADLIVPTMGGNLIEVEGSGYLNSLSWEEEPQRSSTLG